MLFDIAFYSSHDRQQITRATIGEGEIIIRSDPAAGLEGLNRDLEKAQEITKDKKTSVTVYIDSSAIAEVASGGAGIKGNVKKLVDAYKAFTTDLPEETKSKLDSKVEGLGESAEDNMKEMIRNGVDPDVALALLKNELYQQQLVNVAMLEAQYQENPGEFLKQCGIELKAGETVADVEEKASKALQWLASLSDGSSTEADNSGSENLDGEHFIDNPYRLTKGGDGTWVLEDSALQKTLDNGAALRTVLTLGDNSGGFDYQLTDGTTLVLQGLQDARNFIDSIPADDIQMVQAAALGMQLATGGPVKVVLGYAVAMAAEALMGDKIAATKEVVSEEVAAFLQSGALSTDEYKAINCPDGDCSDKYASAGSYAINMDKDNVKFGMDVIIGVVGSIISEKAFQSKYGNEISNALKRFPDDAKPNLVVNIHKQSKHLPGTNEYTTASANGSVKSPINADIDVQNLITQYAGRGIASRGVKGQPGYQEIVKSTVVVGEYVDRSGVSWGQTKNFKIHYAKDGVHIVPEKP